MWRQKGAVQHRTKNDAGKATSPTGARFFALARSDQGLLGPVSVVTITIVITVMTMIMTVIVVIVIAVVVMRILSMVEIEHVEEIADRRHVHRHPGGRSMTGLGRLSRLRFEILPRRQFRSMNFKTDA